MRLRYTTLIGTGKTVTGTHLVYALAMKLHRDTQQSTTPTGEKECNRKTSMCDVLRTFTTLC